MSDKLSQDDIDKMLTGASSEGDSPDSSNAFKHLNEKEVETIGEISNVSMASAANTLSMLLGSKVEIASPKISEYDKIEEFLDVSKDFVAIEVNYKSGLKGTIVFILEKEDTATIADLMMGGDGKVKAPEIGDLQLSAIGEAMNQMIGTSSTTLSSMFNTSIEINSPVVKFQQSGEKGDLTPDIFKTPIIAVTYKLVIGDLINSELVQLITLESVQNQINKLISSVNTMVEDVSAAIKPQPVPTPDHSRDGVAAEIGSHKPVTVQPVQFSSFNDYSGPYAESGKNLDLLMDVKLKLTVELGRTELSIKKVLELTRGSVIELDKIAGEPVELYANGKMIAKGEVVVIEDNFGLRVTSIVSPDSRIKNL